MKKKEKKYFSDAVQLLCNSMIKCVQFVCLGFMANQHLVIYCEILLYTYILNMIYNIVDKIFKQAWALFFEHLNGFEYYKQE